MILLVRPEVLGELVDPDGEERDLRLRRAGVGLVPAVLLEHVELRFLGEAHATSESTVPVLPARRARKDAYGREQGSRKGSRARREGSGARGAGRWRRRRASHRTRRSASRVDVAADLLDQRRLVVEDPLVAQPLPELDEQPLAVEV